MKFNDLFIGHNKLPEPLTKDETYSCFEKIKNGDLKAREYVITHNMRLVINEVCKKFGNTPYEKNELVSIGLVGLVKSVDTFDISKKYEFATYATRCIDNEILMFIRKAKKYIFDQSIDTPIGTDKDGNEQRLEDILEDITSDFVSDYMDESTYNEIRKIVYDLPDRDREIILLYFGFVNNKTYTQREIAQKLNISKSYISRLIKQIVKKIGLQCEEKGIIQGGSENSTTVKQSVNNSNELEKEKRIDMARHLKTIYEYFSNYPRKEVDNALAQLTEEEMKLVRLRYGDDLDHPTTSDNYTESDNTKFYGSIIPKMKRLLKNIKNENSNKKGRKLKTIYDYFKNYTREAVDYGLSQLTDKEMKIVRLKYGDDLDHPVRNKAFEQSTNNRLYSKIFPKMQELLKDYQNIDSISITTTNTEVPTTESNTTSNSSVDTRYDNQMD